VARARTVADSDMDAIDAVERDWRRERPDVDLGSIGVVSRIWRIGRHFERARTERLTAHGADRVTLDVLAMLRRSGPPFRMTAGELTHQSLISSGGVSQRLEKLERAGLLERHLHSSDRRRVDVQLTPAGVELVDATLADVMAHEARLLDHLSADELAQLRRLLRKLLARFEQPSESDMS
jgi:DNA-binding MarR family transcriptional regulator